MYKYIISSLSADFAGGRLASVFPFPRPHSCGSLRHCPRDLLCLINNGSPKNKSQGTQIQEKNNYSMPN